ncbi:hypothetical protein ACWDLG_44650 [Nonomuraea sp. NPDC003727]
MGPPKPKGGTVLTALDIIDARQFKVATLLRDTGLSVPLHHSVPGTANFSRWLRRMLVLGRLGGPLTGNRGFVGMLAELAHIQQTTPFQPGFLGCDSLSKVVELFYQWGRHPSVDYLKYSPDKLAASAGLEQMFNGLLVQRVITHHPDVSGRIGAYTGASTGGPAFHVRPGRGPRGRSPPVPRGARGRG